MQRPEAQKGGQVPFIYPSDIKGALSCSDVLGISDDEKKIIQNVVSNLDAGEQTDPRWTWQLSSLKCWPKVYVCICDLALRRNHYRQRGEETIIDLQLQAKKLTDEKSKIQNQLARIEEESRVIQRHITSVERKRHLLQQTKNEKPLWSLPEKMQRDFAQRQKQQTTTAPALPSHNIQMYPVIQTKRENDADRIDSAAKRRKKTTNPPTPKQQSNRLPENQSVASEKQTLAAPVETPLSDLKRLQKFLSDNLTLLQMW